MTAAATLLSRLAVVFALLCAWLIPASRGLQSPPLGALRRFEYVNDVAIESMDPRSVSRRLKKRSLNAYQPLHNDSVGSMAAAGWFHDVHDVIDDDDNDDDNSYYGNNGGGNGGFDDQDGDVFRLSFVAFRRRFTVELERNPHLLHSDFQVQFNDDDSHQSGNLLPLMRAYRGRVLQEGRNTRSTNDWARITLFDVDHHADIGGDSGGAHFEGVLTLDGQLYTIRSLDTYQRIKRPMDTDTATNERPALGQSNAPTLLIYRESDRVLTAEYNATVPHHADLGDHKCGSESLSYNGDRARLIAQRMASAPGSEMDGVHLAKRALSGCPTSTKILYMGIAADCSYVSNYGGTDAALKQIVSDWNQASRLYESTFNIALGIVRVNMQSTCTTDQSMAWNRACSDSYVISQRLNDFTAWRGTQPTDIGLWHLMTRCSSGETVGISWLDSVCQTSVSTQNQGGQTEYVSGTGVSSVSANEWAIVAHEIGHNFGAIHDCTSSSCSQCPGAGCQCCPCSGNCDCGGTYLMNPTSDVKSDQFSPCTQKLICTRSLSANCLSDPGAKVTITGNQCGNGVKEPGEDCDCGPADGPDCAKDKCCDATTCKYKSTAKCDDYNDKCCSNCQVKPAGSVCRTSRSVCDVQETCNGNDGVCPPDLYLPDLQQCQTSSGQTAQCASGDCTSRDLQCKTRGAVSGTTRECPGYRNQCGVYCDGTSVGQCIQLSGFFVDGSPCGYSGTCRQGTCDQSGWSAALGWAQDHMGIAILLCVIVGLFVLLCIGRGIQVALHNRKMDRMVRSNQRLPPPHRSDGTYPTAQAMANNYSPQLTLDNGASRGSTLRRPQVASMRPQVPPGTGWVDPTAYNGDVANADEIDPETLAAIQAALVSEPAPVHLDSAVQQQQQQQQQRPPAFPTPSSMETRSDIGGTRRKSFRRSTATSLSVDHGLTRPTARSPTRSSDPISFPRKAFHGQSASYSGPPPVPPKPSAPQFGE